MKDCVTLMNDRPISPSTCPVIVSVLEMEDLEKRVIEDLPVVSAVRFHTRDKTHKAGLYVNLRCCAGSSYGGCGAKPVGSIHKSSDRPTTVDCLREPGRVIQRDHGPTCITATQELQAVEKDAADAFTKRAVDVNPSEDTDVSQDPVAMIVNSSELCAVGFDLREVIPLQFEAVGRGGQRTWSSSRFTEWAPGMNEF
jgi:hypothetical protein